MFILNYSSNGGLKLSFQALEIRDIIIIIYCYYYYSDISGCNVHISFYLLGTLFTVGVGVSSE